MDRPCLDIIGSCILGGCELETQFALLLFHLSTVYSDCG